MTPDHRGHPSAVEPHQVHYDIRVVDGPEGKRLAVVQAQAILDVLTWFNEHNGDQETVPEQSAQRTTGQRESRAADA